MPVQICERKEMRRTEEVFSEERLENTEREIERGASKRHTYLAKKNRTTGERNGK